MSSVVVLVLTGAVLLGLCEAKFSVKCSDGSNNNTTLTPTEDGVKGRYLLEWCTDVQADDAHWNIEITYCPSQNLNACPTNRPTRCYIKNHHTSSEEYIYKQLPNCGHVCFSKEMDLLFNACYSISNRIHEHGSYASTSYHNVSNEYTREMFSEFGAAGSYVNHGDYVSVHFNLKNVPAADFILELSQINSSDTAHPIFTQRINENCSMAEYEIWCKLEGLSDGAYKVYINTRAAPWVRGDFVKQKVAFTEFEFSKQRRVVEVAGRGGAWAWAGWAAGAAGVLCAGAALGLGALSCRRAAQARKHVLREWLNRVEKKPAISEVQSPVGPILLLYARECPAAEPIIAALTALLETVAPGQVFDIGSPATLALAGSGGGAWVRGLIARHDTRVVLLQTPALHALHVPRLTTGPEPKLEQPLLSSRCVYRAPAAGDWLLQFALQLLATAHSDLPYRKYYLATLEGLETDALPYAVPFRRYVLPAHAAALLHHLSPPAPPPPPSLTPPALPPSVPHLVDGLAAAVGGFRDYATQHPDYLMEELLIL